MPTLVAPIEKARKQPVQARSVATLDAILDAAIQVLVRVGKEKLTTTLVADRAGVSVGTLYQYFPNKLSLLQSVLRRHLMEVTETFEVACDANHGRPLCELITDVATTFFRTKMREPRASLALYSVSADIDGLRITEDLRVRQKAAFMRAITSSQAKLQVDLEQVSFMLQSTMIGISRRILESRVPARDHAALCEQMVVMLCAYVESVTA